MTVVADTTLFNYLVQLEAVELLATLFGEVLIPGAVHRELCAKGAPTHVRSWASALPSWISVIHVESASLLHIPSLDEGETEAITLSLLQRADVLLIDDGPARRIAADYGLQFLGTLGIPRKASLEGLVDLEVSIAALQRLGFRMSDRLIHEIVGQSK